MADKQTHASSRRAAARATVLAAGLGLLVASPALAAKPTPAPSTAPSTVTGAVPTVAPATAAPDAAALLAAFREAFGAGDFPRALESAQQSVALANRQAPGSAEHISALVNLASTHFKLGDYIAAEPLFVEALNLAEERFGANSPRTIGPLRGLGITLLAQQRPEVAAPVIARAVALSRRTGGLFNDEQLAMSVPLSRAYRMLGLVEDVEREEQYAFRTVEVRHGAESPQLLAALDRLALWYEETGRPAQARGLHRRAFGIATLPKAGTSAGAVHALLGVVRTYFIEYRDGAEQTEPVEGGGGGFSFTSGDAPTTTQIRGVYALDPEAERALKVALEIATRSGRLDLQQDVLVQYGDYLLLDRNIPAAREMYARASALRATRAAAATEGTVADPLAEPFGLLFRRPTRLDRHLMLPRSDVVEHETTLEFTVTADGEVRDVKIVSSDLGATPRRQLTDRAERAIYRPRFAEGKAVDTPGVRMVVVSRTLKGAEKPAAPAADKAPEAAPNPAPQPAAEPAAAPADPAGPAATPPAG